MWLFNIRLSSHPLFSVWLQGCHLRVIKALAQLLLRISRIFQFIVSPTRQITVSLLASLGCYDRDVCTQAYFTKGSGVTFLREIRTVYSDYHHHNGSEFWMLFWKSISFLCWVRLGCLYHRELDYLVHGLS